MYVTLFVTVIIYRLLIVLAISVRRILWCRQNTLSETFTTCKERLQICLLTPTLFMMYIQICLQGRQRNARSRVRSDTRYTPFFVFR